MIQTNSDNEEKKGMQSTYIIIRVVVVVTILDNPKNILFYSRT